MTTASSGQLHPETLRQFPAFAAASDEILSQLIREGVRRKLPADLLICSPGAICDTVTFVLEGRARIFSMGENGREITLYRLEAGNTCVLAASSILSGLPLPAFSVTETAGEVLQVTASVFRTWFEREEFWRGFVFSLLASRLAGVIAITNAKAFRRLDARIADYLLDEAKKSRQEVKTTHHNIAADLGSSREVVSRVLKSFEVEGLVGLRRGAIRLVDNAGLSAKAQQGACPM